MRTRTRDQSKDRDRALACCWMRARIAVGGDHRRSVAEPIFLEEYYRYPGLPCGEKQKTDTRNNGGADGSGAARSRPAPHRHHNNNNNNNNKHAPHGTTVHPATTMAAPPPEVYLAEGFDPSTLRVSPPFPHLADSLTRRRRCRSFGESRLLYADHTPP